MQEIVRLFKIPFSKIKRWNADILHAYTQTQSYTYKGMHSASYFTGIFII